MLSEAQVDTWQHQNSCLLPWFARWFLRSEAITHIISWSRAENLRKLGPFVWSRVFDSKSWSDYVRLFRCQGITLSFHLRLTISNRSFLDCVGGFQLYWPHLQIELPIFPTGAILQSPGFLHRCGCKNMRSWWRIGSKVVRRQFAIQALSACDVHWRCGLRFIFSWSIYHVS